MRTFNKKKPNTSGKQMKETPHDGICIFGQMKIENTGSSAIYLFILLHTIKSSIFTNKIKTNESEGEEKAKHPSKYICI